MGDPRHQGKKYDTPTRPWDEGQMEVESGLLQRYGLKNKRELWKAESELRGYRRKARELLAELGGTVEPSGAAETEAEEFLSKLRRLGILDEGGDLDDVLGLETEDTLDRRLQTVIYRKGLAKTPDQARQFVVHGHVEVGGRKVTVPSYKVSRREENSVEYREGSPLSEELHPESQEATNA